MQSSHAKSARPEDPIRRRRAAPARVRAAGRGHPQPPRRRAGQTISELHLAAARMQDLWIAADDAYRAAIDAVMLRLGVARVRALRFRLARRLQGSKSCAAPNETRGEEKGK